jgi:hypothetical protein
VLEQTAGEGRGFECALEFENCIQKYICGGCG